MSGRLVGMITVDDVVHIIQEEAGEDVLLLSGAGEGDINEPIRLTVRRALVLAGHQPRHGDFRGLRGRPVPGRDRRLRGACGADADRRRDGRQCGDADAGGRGSRAGDQPADRIEHACGRSGAR